MSKSDTKQDVHSKLVDAVTSGDATQVSELISLGADAKSSGPHGPLIVTACTSGHAECARALLAAGADPNAATSHGLPGLFIVAATAAMKLKTTSDSNAAEVEGFLLCMEALLESGANPCVSAPGGFTPTHVAAEVGNERMVKALLAAGADTSVKTSDGQTPAAIAASWGHRSIAETLLRHDPSTVGGSVDTLVEEESAREAERRKAREAAEAATPQDRVPEPEEPDEEKSKALQREGNASFVAREYATALENYRLALKHWTKSAALWSDASAAALRLGMNEDALRDARIARTVDAKVIKAWMREGQAAEALQLWEDAAAAYFEAYLLQPEGIPDSKIDFGDMVKVAAERGRLAAQRKAKEEKKAAAKAAKGQK